MKVLIRDNEIYAETSWSPFTQNHLDWCHTARPNGDGYALCSDCPYSDVEPSDFDIETIVESSPGDPLSEEEPSTITRRIATFNKEKYDARKQEQPL